MAQTESFNNIRLGLLIKEKARELGFDACGFAKADAVETNFESFFKSWLSLGFHAQMDYMAANVDKRIDPRVLVPGCKTIVSLALNYHQQNYQPIDTFYRISSYAAGKDYHYVMKSMMYQLLDFIKVNVPAAKGRVFTDSAPVLERYWAWKAGLGMPGKNACFIIPKKGSWFFLSEILLNIELPADDAFSKNLCGKCTQCMQACPTGAIESPGVVNSWKCISYLTIENKEEVLRKQLSGSHGFIYGCDICQSVCPHNQKFAQITQCESFRPLVAISSYANNDWEELDEKTFKREFVKTQSPIARVKHHKIKDTIIKTKHMVVE